MTEKKFLDVRISVSQEITNWTYEEIERRLNSAFSFIAFKVTPLPELASEVNKILSKYYACDNINCGKGAICNYCAIRKDLEALLGKVALPSPEPEKETKGIDIGVVVKDENTLISPLLIDGKVVDKVGIYPSEVENIMVWVVDRNIRINPKPPEKKELPILIPLLVDEEPDKKLMIDTINALIDIIREMRSK